MPRTGHSFFTRLFRLTVGGAALPVHAALDRFARAYASSTGATLAANALQLRNGRGPVFGGSALLPCGFPAGTDFFVCGVPALDGRGTTRTLDAPAAQAAILVTAREGSAVAASQAKMGEHSYYYSVGKAGDPTRPPVRLARRPRSQSLWPFPSSRATAQLALSSVAPRTHNPRTHAHSPLAGTPLRHASSSPILPRHYPFSLVPARPL
jgi:hypothetical protein